MKQIIADGLTAARRKLSQLHHTDVPRVDVEQIAKELDLENEAHKLAAAGLPSPDQTALTAVEARAVQRIEDVRRECVRWASARLDALNFRNTDDIALLVSDGLAADKAFEQQAARVIGEHEHLLNELANEADVRERELTEFRARNRLTRPATFPEGSATFARYAILLALVVVEAAANAYFFSQGLESGLMGGFLAAGLFAAVNLVTAFVLGKYAVPLIFHRHRAVISLGSAGTAFAIAWMIAMALTIAHFRDALVADAPEPARTAWLALQAAPLTLRDVMSWLLFAISVLFAAFALFDGLSSDDAYPGYGRVARRARQAREDYVGELQAVRSLLDTIKSDEIGRIDGNTRKARALLAVGENRIRDKKWTRTQLETALLDAENCLTTLLRVFRDAASLHRANLPLPHYFESRPALQKLALPDFGIEEERAKLDAHERLVEHFLAQASQVRTNIEVAFNRYVEHLKPEEQRLSTFAARPKLVGSSTRQR